MFAFSFCSVIITIYARSFSTFVFCKRLPRASVERPRYPSCFFWKRENLLV